MITTAEKLSVAEHLIEDFRWARGEDPERVPEARTYRVLKAIAVDLRARMDRAPNEAEVAIERRMVTALRSKTALGYANGAMVGLAQEVIGRWPAVKQGLELLRDKSSGTGLDKRRRLLIEACEPDPGATAEEHAALLLELINGTVLGTYAVNLSRAKERDECQL